MKKSTLINIIFAAAVIIIAAGLFLFRNAKVPQGELMAQLIYGDDNTVMDIPLDKDQTFTVDTGYLTVTIEVKEQQARFIDSQCSDHVCENYGWIRMEDQQAVCMPGHAVLMIVPVQ